MNSKKLDQFYTKKEISKDCFKECSKIVNLNDYFLFEPSAGYGSFSDLFHKNSLAIDLEPKKDYIKKINFFNINKEFFNNKDVFTIGNPPFGFKSSLAIKFFNECSIFSKYIGFIIPKTFKKESILNRLNKNMFLIKEIELPKNSFEFLNQEYNVPCIFQIWEKRKEFRNKIEIKKETIYFDFVEKKEADFAIRRIGVYAGKIIKNFQRYKKSSHYFIKINEKINKEELIEILKELYSKLNMIASNSAGIPSLSKSELIKIFEKKIKIIINKKRINK